MEWLRYHPKAAVAAAALVTVLVIAAVWALLSGDDPEGPSAFGDSTTGPTTAPLTELPTASPSATPTKKNTGTIEGQVANGLKGLSGGGSASGGNLQLPGLQGGSMYKYLPKHAITLRVSSAAPIGTIGYIMPTSLNESSGVVKNYQGKSWAISSTVYGDPDYAQIFVQAGARGYPITCTITVDGRVTEQRATEGPYGQLVCQG